MLSHVLKEYSVLFTKALPFTFLICGITATPPASRMRQSLQLTQQCNRVLNVKKVPLMVSKIIVEGRRSFQR